MVLVLVCIGGAYFSGSFASIDCGVFNVSSGEVLISSCGIAVSCGCVLWKVLLLILCQVVLQLFGSSALLVFYLPSWFSGTCGFDGRVFLACPLCMIVVPPFQ